MEQTIFAYESSVILKMRLGISVGPIRQSSRLRIQDTIPAEFDLEESIIGEMVLERLREQLANWKPWALELLDFYLDGKKKTCAKVLGEKYGISAMAMSKRKKLFDEFLKTFFSDLV